MGSVRVGEEAVVKVADKKSDIEGYRAEYPTATFNTIAFFCQPEMRCQEKSHQN